MLYGIDVLHNYGNECNTDRGVDKGKFFGEGLQTLTCQQRKPLSIAVSKNYNG